MPAQSKSQQRFFGVVKAMQKGDIPKKGKAGKIAKSMSKDDVDDFASTKHKGKPEKVKREQRVRNLIKKMVREELAKMNEVRIPFSSSHIKQLKRAFKDMKGTLPDNNPLVQQIVTLLKKTDKKVLKQIATADIKYLSDKAKNILGEGKYDRELIRLDNATAKEFGSWKSEVLKLSKLLPNSEKKKINKDIMTINKLVFNITKTFDKNLDEGTCGYGENGQLGEEPAGPHLIKKKKMKEEVEPIGGMAKIAKIVKDKQHAKVGGQTVDMQSANLLMKLYNAVKDKDKEKMNKMSEKKLIMVLNKLWSRVKLKLPT